MRPADLFLYLLGHRGAIERIAASKSALFMGALLVLTAGIARNYDHLDLLREPEWFLAPFLVSFFSAAVVFLCVHFRLDLYWSHGRRHHFRPFLTLFWMTAPCAWLYAIPFEAFTDILTATKFNVALLAIVSFWRVALITRAVHVLTGGRVWAVLLAVLVPACAEAWVGSIFRGFSLVGIMGGVRLPPHHQFLQAAADLVTTGSFWLGISLAPFFFFLPRRLTRAPRGLSAPAEKAPSSTWFTASALLALWVAAGSPLQPKMQRRHHLQELIDHKREASAIRYAIAHGPGGFASWHYLPPDPFGRRFAYANLFTKMDGSEPEWLRTIWLEQSIEALKMQIGGGYRDYRPYLEAYEQVSGGWEFLLAHEEELRGSIADDDGSHRATEKAREEFDRIFTALKEGRNPEEEPSASRHLQFPGMAPSHHGLTTGRDSQEALAHDRHQE